MKAGSACLTEEPKATAAYRLPYLYYGYGISLYSEPLRPLPNHGRGELAHIALSMESESWFAEAIDGVSLEQGDGSWYQLGLLPDGSSYAKWEGVGEFHVSSSGQQIRCR